MKHFILLIAWFLFCAFVLTGCGMDKDYDNVPHMVDDVTEQNAEFKITHTLPVEQLAMIDLWWSDIEYCTGLPTDLTAAQLHIEYMDLDQVHYIEDDVVKYVNGVIWVDHQYAKVVQSDLVWGQGNVTRHEMMHYILWLNGQPRGHDNPMFAKCQHLMGNVY